MQKSKIIIAAVAITTVVLVALVLTLTIVLLQDSGSEGSDLVPVCDSRIYCQGDLLHYAQTLNCYTDSKTFVDFALTDDEDVVLQHFDDFMKEKGNNPSSDDMMAFIEANFDNSTSLVEWTPSDFNQNPPFLATITDPLIRQFASDVVGRWRNLGRKVNEAVRTNPSRYSIYYVPNGIIVPGGRFREYYYWDSYWIIDGLLVSDMKETAKGMIGNFIETVKNLGHIPNGGRVYYARRTQPPLLNLMARIYYDSTNDVEWLRQNVAVFDAELEFWLNNRTIDVELDGKTYKAALYNAPSSGPRPESYREDVEAAENVQELDKKNEIYIELKSAAESGWDFSSRWIVDNEGGRNGPRNQTKITRIVPVDLNAFLYGAFDALAYFYRVLGNNDKASYWTAKANDTYTTISEILWNSIDSVWYDYDYVAGAQRRYFAASNLAPLWTGAYNRQGDVNALVNGIIAYLQREKITEYQGGIPITTLNTGEQWDFPNVWPPLVSVIVEGLEKTGTTQGKALARTFAEAFVNGAKVAFDRDQDLYEKYDAEVPGKYGGGGEYEVQLGFGWTNGVVLRFINSYYTGAAQSNIGQRLKRNNNRTTTTVRRTASKLKIDDFISP